MRPQMDKKIGGSIYKNGFKNKLTFGLQKEIAMELY